MYDEVIRYITSLGFKQVRLYEDTGYEVYFDAYLWSGERVEVREQKSKIHYRYYGIGEAWEVEWLEAGKMSTDQPPPRASESAAEHTFGDKRTNSKETEAFEQLSLFP